MFWLFVRTAFFTLKDLDIIVVCKLELMHSEQEIRYPLQLAALPDEYDKRVIG